jgi:PTS system fructose-specific IIC component
MKNIKLNSTNKKSIWTVLYDDLMGGLRPMIPFVAGGGILMAISFMLGMGTNQESTGYFARTLYEIGHNNAMVLLVPVFAGYISFTMAGASGLAPGMVGGMIAKNTGSGFFGGIVAGLLAGYTIRLLEKVLKKFPSSFESLKRLLILPIISMFIVGFVMFSVIAGPMSWINTSLSNWISSLGTTNLVLTGCILGGMMAFDLGGPINKVAYTFALVAINDGNYYPMAAVMAGGLVPPIAVALATTLFKKKFTEDQRIQGKTYYLLGASFITESCMPVALSDPFRIIPCAIIGSAISGALTMVFKVALPAPHGGVFVIPVIEGGLLPKLLFILSIAIGTLVSAVLIGLLRKPIKEDIQNNIA